MLHGVLGRDESVHRIVSLMRVLSEPTRLRLLCLLESGERNVSALCGELELPQPTVSHHLGLLREAGLVTNRRAGKQVFYSLNDASISTLAARRGMAIEAGDLELRIQPLIDGNGHHPAVQLAQA